MKGHKGSIKRHLGGPGTELRFRASFWNLPVVGSDSPPRWRSGLKDFKIPRGSINTTIMELGPERPSPLWFWGPNSIIVVYMDPLGLNNLKHE